MCNRNELAALTGGSSAEAATESLIEQARIPLAWGVANLVVTLGRQGSIWLTADESVTVPAFPVNAVDTVGAGDCFCGVFAAALSEGFAPRAALRAAAAAAAISTTRRARKPRCPRAKRWMSFSQSGEPHGNHRATGIDAVRGTYRSLVELHNLLNDRQTKTGAVRDAA